MFEGLHELERQLSPLAATFGFVLSDSGESDADSADGTALWQLEYRTATDGQNALRLDICQISDARSISAEVWSPADLATLPPDIGVDAVAIHRRVWFYSETQDAALFVHEIVEQISRWLMQSTSGYPPLQREQLSSPHC